jgi:hypothetical protein
MSFSTNEYQLTEKESDFIQKFLANNGCCANTPEDLLADNFSCQTIEDMEDFGYSKNQVAGLLSSLIKKQIIWVEDRDGTKANKNNFMTFEPDLYWVNDNYLETLDPTLQF